MLVFIDEISDHLGNIFLVIQQKFGRFHGAGKVFLCDMLALNENHSALGDRTFGMCCELIIYPLVCMVDIVYCFIKQVDR